jgi:hypothetical protein
VIRNTKDARMPTAIGRTVDRLVHPSTRRGCAGWPSNRSNLVITYLLGCPMAKWVNCSSLSPAFLKKGPRVDRPVLSPSIHRGFSFGSK